MLDVALVLGPLNTQFFCQVALLEQKISNT